MADKEIKAKIDRSVREHRVESTVPGETRLRVFKARTRVVGSGSGALIVAWSPDSMGPPLAYSIKPETMEDAGAMKDARDRAASDAVVTYLTRGWGCKGLFA